MSTLRRLLALLATALTLTFAARSNAQATAATVALGTTVTHVEPKPGRPGTLANTFLTHHDCEVDDVINFTVNLSGSFAGDTLQAWAGTGCDNAANRGQTTTASVSCWLVYQGVPNSTAPSTTVPIHVRDILYGKTILSTGNCTSSNTGGTGGTAGTGGTDTGGTGGNDTGGTGGTDVGGTAGTSAGGTSGSAGAGGTSTCSGGTVTTPPLYNLISGTPIAACNPSNLVSTVASPVSVYFLLVGAGSQANASNVVAWAATYKLYAPPPPDTIGAGVGDGLLIVNFKYATPPADQPTGFNFYCIPSNALDGPDAGATDLDCDPAPENFMAGTLPGPDLQHCGSVGMMSQQGNATGLVNLRAYRVAVSTTDAYGNAGVLSGSACQIPEPVTGFYKAYRAAGGTAGGGFCSFSNKREPIVLCLLLAIGAGLIVRRRRAA